MKVSCDFAKVSQLYDFLVCEIQKKFNQELYGKIAIIGLSGGIDSAVVASLMKAALGSDDVIGVLLPYAGHSSNETFEDAKSLSQNLGIQRFVFQIENACQNVEQGFLKTSCCGLDPIASQNVQARMRMIYLMALANSASGVVVNTCNLTEDMIGYNTMYGDSIGAFAPMGKIGKQAVYALANYINSEYGNPIPQTIIDRKPSAELAPGQEDEKDIGIPYSLLDPITQTYKNGAIVQCPKVSAKKLSELLQRIEANAFKLKQAPPSIPLGKIKMGNTCEFIRNKTCMKCEKNDCPSKYFGELK